MKNILISGASGIVGYGILRSLKKANEKLKLIGTSIYTDSVAPGFCDIFELAPPTDDKAYMQWLLDTINKHQIDLIIPGIEIDIFKWISHLPEIEESGAVALLNNMNLIKLCKDKWKFFKDINEANLSCVIDSTLCTDFDILCSKLGLPFLLKPRIGSGSKGIVIVNSSETFLNYEKYIGEIFMVQPIVGNDDEEYTTSAFCDGAGGFYSSITLKRKLSKDGFTEKAEVIATNEFIETISELCNRFHPLGPTNFQFRKSNEGVKLLEINPRISSSTSIRTAFGYNECEMAVDYFLRQKILNQPDIKQGKAIRYTDEYIFYEDSIHI